MKRSSTFDDFAIAPIPSWIAWVSDWLFWGIPLAHELWMFLRLADHKSSKAIQSLTEGQPVLPSPDRVGPVPWMILAEPPGLAVEDVGAEAELDTVTIPVDVGPETEVDIVTGEEVTVWFLWLGKELEGATDPPLTNTDVDCG